MDYFSSDWHIGHRNILTLSKRPFESMEEMRDQILQNMTSIMKKGDTLYFLGDLAFSQADAEYVLDYFKARRIAFVWVLGNHDSSCNPKKLVGKCQKIVDTLVYKNKAKGIRIHLSHFPLRVWSASFHNSFHLYGHVHMFSPELAFLEDQPYGKSLNVNLEFNNYGPYSLEDIVTIMEGKPDNADYSIMQDFQNKK